MRLRRGAVLAVGVAAAAVFAHSDEHKSDTIEGLLKEVESNGASALEAFWSSLKEKGAPIVEPIDGDPGHSLVTFVWQGDTATENVVLVGGLARGELWANRLKHLEGTDLWFKSVRFRNDLRASYQFSPNDSMERPDSEDPAVWQALIKNFRADPLNPKKYTNASLIELPDAPPQPWIEVDLDTPRGNLNSESGFKSSVLNNERTISVYTPAGYSESAGPYPMVLLFDQESYLSVVPTPRILDNMIHAGALQPVVCVLVGNAKGARNTELPCNEAFAKFIAEELVPWVRAHYHVSTDPKRAVIGGSSYGGLAASFVALRHPELFGNVLSQSGSYWWAPDWKYIAPDPEAQGEWLTSEYARVPAQPIRFYIECGLLEGWNPTMATANRHFRNVLSLKGYDIVRYSEFNGGHEYLIWRGTLSEGLAALLGVRS